MCLNRCVYTIYVFCIALILGAGPALAGGPPQTGVQEYRLTYKVKRDGALIGSYAFDVREARDSYAFDARLEIDVSILGFSVYALKHKRSEEWRNGRLVSLEGRSIYDGDERYKIRLKHDTENSYRLKVNGDTQLLKGRIVSFSPRQPASWDQARLISLKGNADTVTRHKRGTRQLTINGKRYWAERYRLKGDIVRDLWYDDKKRLLKLSYKKDGATITFVRKSIVQAE